MFRAEGGGKTESRRSQRIRAGSEMSVSASFGPRGGRMDDPLGFVVYENWQSSHKLNSALFLFKLQIQHCFEMGDWVRFIDLSLKQLPLDFTFACLFANESNCSYELFL